MKSKTIHSLIITLILTVCYLTQVNAVDDAELEALEKQIEQLESEGKKQAEALEKKKAEAEKRRLAELERQRREEQKRIEEEKQRQEVAIQKEQDKKKAEEERLAELEKQRQEEENRALEENPDITFISPNTYTAEGKSLWNEQAALNDAKKKATNFCNRTGKILVYHSHYLQDTPIYGYVYMNYSCQ